MVRLMLFLYGIFLMVNHIQCGSHYIRNSNEPYENDTLIQLMSINKRQHELLNRLSDIDPELDILKYSTGVYSNLEVLVPPNKLDFIYKFSRRLGLRVNVKARNYGRYMDANIARLSTRFLSSSQVDYNYNSHEDMRSLYKSIADKNSKLIQLESLGKSFEGRPMDLVKISKDPDGNNPVIFIDAGIHAREWVASATAMYFIEQLVDPSNASDLDKVDYYILPMVNPDGYEFSRTVKRLWRKTRSKRNHSKCVGVDGNRNYGYKWAAINAVHDPCDVDTYVGPNAFSEVETSIVRDVMKTYLKRIKLYITLHSFGQMILYPWGYSTGDSPENAKVLHELGVKVEKAMVDAGAPSFKVMSAASLYITTGSSTDYSYSIGIPYSYAIELTDGYEFDFPESKLSSTVPAFYRGLQKFAQEISSEFS